jgi:hypothetical protein
MQRVSVSPERHDVPTPQGRVGQRMVQEIIVPGLLAGWAAGLAMLLAAMIGAAVAGLPVSRPLQLAAGFVLDHQALRLGAGSTVLGLFIHLAVAGFLGVLFNTTLPRAVTFAWAVSAALIFSVVIYLFMTWVVMPWQNPLLFRTVPKGALLVYHLVFGAVLPLALPLRRRSHARRMSRARARARAQPV